MNAASRKERLCGISTILVNNPNVLYPLSYFAEMFGSAKSTLSEDMAIVKASMEKLERGEIEVVMGAGGGVRYLPKMSEHMCRASVEEILEKLREPGRVLPGGFIYTADIFLSPVYVDKMARILWGFFSKAAPDFIVTVEAKGIPLAMEVARLFGKPLVVARKESKLTEGSVVTINYLSGSSKRLQTMSLSKRAVREGQRAVVIDDFIAGGGTVKAVCDLMKEFSIMVAGCGVAISMKPPGKKRVEGYRSIVHLENVDEETGMILVESAIDRLNE